MRFLNCIHLFWNRLTKHRKIKLNFNPNSNYHLKMTISYCIAVHNEHVELNLLLEQLFKFLGPNDEIIVQGDQGKVTNRVISVLHSYTKDARLVYLEYPLQKDFATFKNNMVKQAKKDYVFLLDADEFPPDFLLSNLEFILEANSEIEVIRIPRTNVVQGLTNQHIKKWKWKVDLVQIQGSEFQTVLREKYNITTDQISIVNFPDYQSRIWKNHLGIEYYGKVHEQLEDFKSYSHLPADLEYSIFHVKGIDRQEKQNEFYEICSK